MRLFKRNTSDPSPQLVSATPISQDGSAFSLSAPDRRLEESNKKSSSFNDDNGISRVFLKETMTADAQKARTAQSSTSARKGISTWGRKVGRRWDQLKRSDSSELLSVSSRRRRWSPNRKNCSGSGEKKENGADALLPELPKPKRISRVESLRNIFRSSERNSNLLSNEMSSRTLTIEEEDVTCIGHYPMEKALSEGMIKNVPFCANSKGDDFHRGTLLHEKKKQLSRSIQDLQEQRRMLDYILKNQEILKTKEGSDFAKETLGKASPEQHSSHQSAGNRNSAITQTREFQLYGVKKNLFNLRTSGSECRNERSKQSCVTTGLEDLMNNLRLGCDESGYDSDSTRAGADSPDSGKSVPPTLKQRSFSITSDDYHGIDLSLSASGARKKNAATDTDSNAIENVLDETMIASKSFLSESVRTDTTTLMSEGEDTDSCDEETFQGFTDFQATYNKFAKPEFNLSVEAMEGSEDGAKTSAARSTSDADSCNVEMIRNNVDACQSQVVAGARTPGKTFSRAEHFSRIDPSKNPLQIKNRRHSNVSVLNLLENAVSPCKDSPPTAKIGSSDVASPAVRYYSPKRSRTALESETADDPLPRNKVKKSAATNVVQQSTPTKTLVRRELKTMKLTVEKPGSLGISVYRREAARPYYVISKMDGDGEAAKSKQFRVGDEIVRICGRRLRGMSFVEARNMLRNCVGSVELQIAREPTFTFGEEIGDTWGDIIVRTRSDSEVWTLKDSKAEESLSDSISQKECKEVTCKVIGALFKNGKNVSMSEIESGKCASKSTGDGCDEKMTGMRKFQVRKRGGSATKSCARRATSLSMDLLTVTLEKGTTKKLGFSIVGGSDSNKGCMGIFVKDILAGGQAADEGTLRVGDEILAINGASMDGLTHAKALQSFKAAKAGKIVLHIGRRDPSHKRYFSQSKSYDCLNKLAEAGDE